MSIRDAFVSSFSEGQAWAIEQAAEVHANDFNSQKGSDPFKWALAITIGYQCLEIERYRMYHNIVVPFKTLRRWVVEHADLKTHDGDVDYPSLMADVYKDWILRP